MRRIVLAAFFAAPILVFQPKFALAQMSAEEERDKLKAADGIEVDVFASEPMVVNPSAIDVDAHGRVWAAEIQWYRNAAKSPPADKIKVLEDTDGDGKADKATVFADGLFCPMSVCVAGTRVYVATSPDLWVFEDKDGDLRADGPPTRLLTGFGGHNHDHGAHSLVLGPDHLWYMAHGDGGFDVKGTDDSRVAYRWGAMLRGELDGGRLEIVAKNFRNPYELCVSSFGEIYCSDNDNDGNQSARICWIIEGGDYGWFGAPPARVPPSVPFAEHWHFRGHLPGYVPATLVTGFGSPCGICFCESRLFGEELADAPWHADAGPREVRVYPHRDAGMGKRGLSRVVLSTAGDSYFRPDDVCVAPDGSVYVSDWYDGGVGGHAYNDPTKGRVFRLRPKGRRPIRPSKPLSLESISDALAALASPNLATQYLARERLLASPEESAPALANLASVSTDPNVQARALWVLDRIGGEGRGQVAKRLSSDDPRFRALAVRILRRRAGEYDAAILALANDPSPAVRREVLLAIARRKDEASFETLARLAERYDGADRYELELLHIAAGARKKDLFNRLSRGGGFSMERFGLFQLLDSEGATALLIGRLEDAALPESDRLAAIDQAGRLVDPAVGGMLLKIAASQKTSPVLRERAFQVVAENLGGSWKPLLDDRASFIASLRGMFLGPGLAPIAISIARAHRLRELGPDLLRAAEDPKFEPQARSEAIEALAVLRPQGVLEALRRLAADGPPEARLAAAKSLAELQDVRTLRKILLSTAPADPIREAVVDKLFSSDGGALFLGRLLEQKALGEAERDAIIDRGAAHPDANIRAVFEAFLPPERRSRRLGEVVQPAEILAMPADPSRGERIFHESAAAGCKSCHKVDGVGGDVGPDLSRIGKKYERAALLETILDPSKAVAPEFKTYALATADGDLHIGLLAEDGEQGVALKDSKGRILRFSRSEVGSLVPQPKSLMPELVLRDVSAQDAADLLAYLSTRTDAVQPAARLRICGPFDAADGRGIETVYPPESALGDPDLAARFPTLQRSPSGWELLSARSGPRWPVFDLAAFSRERRTKVRRIANYLLAFVDSPAEQQGTLLYEATGRVKIWLQGRAIHTDEVPVEKSGPARRAPLSLSPGRNILVVKHDAGNVAGSVSLAIRSPSPVQISAD